MHKPVLLKEVIKILNSQSGQIYIDATIGDGGHAQEIIERIRPDGKLLGIDWDREQIDKLKSKFSNYLKSGNLILINDNYKNLENIIEQYNIRKINGILFDLGFSRYHIEGSGKGFSFQKNEPLIMRYDDRGLTPLEVRQCSISEFGRKAKPTYVFDLFLPKFILRLLTGLTQMITRINPPTFSVGTEPREKDLKTPFIPPAEPHNILEGGGINADNDTEGVTAAEIVNTWPREKLEEILKEYGEEKFYKQIAEKIYEERKKNPIKTTFDLVEIIEKAVPSWYARRKIHPATKTFQALRIAANDEFENIKTGLSAAVKVLAEGGKMVIIAFHSGEDRIVKNFLKDRAEEGILKIINKKVIKPSYSEIRENSGARSAKLRAATKLR